VCYDTREEEEEEEEEQVDGSRLVLK